MLISIKKEIHTQNFINAAAFCARMSREDTLAKFPAMSTAVAHDKSGHRFISTSSLNLIIRAISFAAFATLKQIGFGALYSGQLSIVDSLFYEFIAEFLHFVTCHFLRGHFCQLLCSNRARYKIRS